MYDAKKQVYALMSGKLRNDDGAVDKNGKPRHNMDSYGYEALTAAWDRGNKYRRINGPNWEAIFVVRDRLTVEQKKQRSIKYKNEDRPITILGLAELRPLWLSLIHISEPTR